MIPTMEERPLRITIATGGRFHADQMVLALLENGHRVKLFTSFPRLAFPCLPPGVLRSFVLPEIIFRGFRHLFPSWAEGFKMRLFAKRLSRALGDDEERDFLICWSSFGLEAMKVEHPCRKIVVRDSSHIRFQLGVLRLEYERVGLHFSPPMDLMDREEEEYARADHIVVLSEFAKRTFIECGVPKEKIGVLKLGVDLNRFSVISKRKPTLPLKIIYFGNISLRKGIPYLLEATKDFPSSQISVTLLGSVDPSMRRILKEYTHVNLRRPLTQSKLALVLPDFDIFVFPTIEDGFGQALPQAMACGLVPIVTDRCGAAEIIVSGENGYLIPAGSAIAIRYTLQQILDRLDFIETVRHESIKTASSFGWENYSLSLNQWLRRIQFTHSKGILKN